MSHKSDTPGEILSADGVRLTRQPRPDGSTFSLEVPVFQVQRGQSLFLCGPSGSGKSTLLRILAGLEQPGSGVVSFGEIDLVYCPAAVWRANRKQIGVVHQDPREYLNDRRITADIVADVLAVHDLDGEDAPSPTGWVAHVAAHLPWVRTSRRRHAKAETLLGRVGISVTEARRTPVRLSGGQRQRIAIARALVSDPALLFLDEPTSALDVSVQAGVMTLLAELKAERNLTVVMVTHNVGLACQFADRVVVMDAGRIVEDGEVEEVFRAPKCELTRKLIEASTHGIPNPIRTWFRITSRYHDFCGRAR